ncbi:MAG: helix-turn-helix transcriptional regulator [Eubacterium sp.]|nr:helix-turn-helix transcriptional regulator [Eubacterium sp.]
MKITIGENIKNLRTKQHITQEQLAESLGVSPQAVSRWENESAYPDIAMLPVIADIFDITVDRLLGTDNERREAEIKKILEDSNALKHEGKTGEALTMLREKVKEHPNSAELLYDLAAVLYSWYWQGDNSFSDEENKNYAREVVEVCRRALKYSDKSNVDYGCKQLMVYNLAILGEHEQAKEIAGTLPDVWVSYELLYPRALPKKEARKAFQDSALVLMDTLNLTLGCISVKGDEQLLQLQLMREKLICTILGEYRGFYAERLYYLAAGQAEIYKWRGDVENTLDALEKAYGYAHEFEERAEVGDFSVPWLDDVHDYVSNTTKHSERTCYDYLSELISNEEFTTLLSGNERYEALKAKLAEHTA